VNHIRLREENHAITVCVAMRKMYARMSSPFTWTLVLSLNVITGKASFEAGLAPPGEDRLPAIASEHSREQL